MTEKGEAFNRASHGYKVSCESVRFRDVQVCILQLAFLSFT